MSFDLRSFLRRAPKPRKLRFKTGDDEERTIDLGAGRTRWHAAEETLKTAGAVSVECLDAKDTILRAHRLSEEDIEESDEEKVDNTGKALSKERRELAGMFDAYGKQLNMAFDRGAEAASASSGALISLVQELTANLTIAMTNLHNLSANYANALQAAANVSGGGEGEDGNGAKLIAMLGPILAPMIAAHANGSPPPTPPTNGKKP